MAGAAGKPATNARSVAAAGMSELGYRVMRTQMVVLSAVMAAFWLYGLLGQLHSRDAAMRYLALSAAIVAVCVWRLRPLPALRRRFRDRRRPPE
jgi:hypothetical protein